MASPPYRSPATSPPYPHHIPLPNAKKRPSLSLSSQPPPSKRRKPSSLAASTPNSSHPLRQTSFPPEGSAIDNGARSPSVESDVTGVTGVTGDRSVSVVTGGRAAKGKGKRKRGDDGESVKTGKDGKGTTELAADEAAEEEEEEEGDEGVEGEEKLDKEQERRNLAILVEAFNPDQADRYDLFRRVKLKKETVRKIVNQTLSQSVPPSVITSINAYTKIFIGNLIERARDVQEQYAAAALPLPPDEDAPSSRPNGPSASINASYQHDPTSPTDIDTNPFAQLKEYASPESPLEPPQPDESTKNRKKKKKNQENLGPLLPDHLREALRRYKKAGEGGGVGMGAQSLVGMGVPGVGSARVGGRRLFK